MPNPCISDLRDLVTPYKKRSTGLQNIPSHDDFGSVHLTVHVIHGHEVQSSDVDGQFHWQINISVYDVDNHTCRNTGIFVGM